jgi:putrescine transport system permease protein
VNAPQRGLAGRLVVVVPYLWLAAFFLLPFLIVVRISLSQAALAQPPYEPLLDWAAGWEGVKAFLAALSFDNFTALAEDTLYLDSYLKSLQIAGLSTALLLLVGYPIAYAMARAPRRWQPVLLMLIILPFWTSLLIRVYALMNILQHDGLLNQLLVALGFEPRVWLATDTAVYLGIVYSYLPFMVLPLYATLERLDQSLLEAAADLGAPPWNAFWTVTLPLSRPGIAAGALLCFIPIVGEFIIPDLLGASDTLMIGRTLWTEFFANRDWPLASAVAVLLLLILVVPIAIYQHVQARALEREG